MIGKYRIRFDIWGLIFFIIIMLPNFIWFAIPAPNDILRYESVTPKLDMIASICQITMTIALCVCVNRDNRRIRLISWLGTMAFCILIYYGCWVFYYLGIANTVVILGLTIAPCLAFLFFGITRRNIVAVIPIIVFTGCHIVHAIVNYMM